MEVSSGSAGGSDKAGRVLSVLVFLLLFVGGAFMIIKMVDVAGTSLCRDTSGKCLDESSSQKTLSLIVGFAGGGIGVIAALLGIRFVMTGRRGGLVVGLVVAAIVLSGVGILIGGI